MSRNTETTTVTDDEFNVDLRGVEWVSALRPAIVVLIVGLLVAPLVSISNYVGYVALLVLMFGVMATGYNVMLGWPNLLVFCPAALAVIGGITSAFLAIEAGLPFVVTLLIGGAVSAIVGTAVAVSAIVIGSTFEVVIATLAFEQIVFYVLINWKTVGPTGISGIPYPSLGPILFTSQLGLYLFLLVVFTLVVLLVAVFDRSLAGTLAIATSENEDLLRSIGYNPAYYKTLSVVLGSFILGIGGALYAHVNGLIAPGSFTLGQTVFLLVIAVVGGLRTVYGPIVGATLMVGLPEIIRSFGLGNVKSYLIGGTLILVVLFLPRGILGGVYDQLNLSNSGGVSVWTFWK